MECFVSSVIKSQNDAFSHKETENNICRRRHGHAVLRFFSDEGVVDIYRYIDSDFSVVGPSANFKMHVDQQLKNRYRKNCCFPDGT